jgi:hypothetical protein
MKNIKLSHIVTQMRLQIPQIDMNRSKSRSPERKEHSDHTQKHDENTTIKLPAKRVPISVEELVKQSQSSDKVFPI